MDSKRLYHSTPTHTHTILNTTKCSLCAWLAKMVDFLFWYRSVALKKWALSNFGNICLFLLALYYSLCLTLQMPVTTREKENNNKSNSAQWTRITVVADWCIKGHWFVCIGLDLDRFETKKNRFPFACAITHNTQFTFDVPIIVLFSRWFYCLYFIFVDLFGFRVAELVRLSIKSIL